MRLIWRRALDPIATNTSNGSRVGSSASQAAHAAPPTMPRRVNPASNGHESRKCLAGWCDRARGDARCSTAQPPRATSAPAHGQLSRPQSHAARRPKRLARSCRTMSMTSMKGPARHAGNARSAIPTMSKLSERANREDRAHGCRRCRQRGLEERYHRRQSSTSIPDTAE